jgi:hypothetical protein
MWGVREASVVVLLSKFFCVSFCVGASTEPKNQSKFRRAAQPSALKINKLCFNNRNLSNFHLYFLENTAFLPRHVLILVFIQFM